MGFVNWAKAVFFFADVVGFNGWWSEKCGERWTLFAAINGRREGSKGREGEVGLVEKGCWFGC